MLLYLDWEIPRSIFSPRRLEGDWVFFATFIDSPIGELARIPNGEISQHSSPWGVFRSERTRAGFFKRKWQFRPIT
jgi:hypothetical protein